MSSSNTSLYTDGKGLFLFRDLRDRIHRFKASQNELIITFERSSFTKLQTMSLNGSGRFEILAYNLELKDSEQADFDGIARLAIQKKSSMEEVIENLMKYGLLNAWMPAMDEIQEFGPATRWFLPSIIVQLKDSYLSDAEDLIEKPKPDGWSLKILRRHYTKGLYAVNLPEFSNTSPAEILFKTLADYISKSEVRFAEFDEIAPSHEGALRSSDPGYAQANGGWHHDDSMYDTEVWIEEAWDTTQGDPDVRIAIVDTGIRSTHDDFDVVPAGFPSPKIVDMAVFDGSGTCNDTDGHGTKVAGVAGAYANPVGSPGFGVPGVAPKCSLVCVKIPLGDSYPYSARADGINYVRDQAAIEATPYRYVMNLSWTCNHSTLIQTAIGDAWAANVLVVAAAGDSGKELGTGAGMVLIYPACFANVIPVAGYQRSNAKPLVTVPPSNKGTIVVMAPGQNIAAPCITSDICWTSANSGTSISTAIVSGIAALAWSKDKITHGAFTRNNAFIRNAIITDAGTRIIAGYPNAGRISAKDVLALM